MDIMVMDMVATGSARGCSDTATAQAQQRGEHRI